MKSLTELHNEQDGKVSDKWNLYLLEYNRVLMPYRNQPLNLLEIGIQNGGSLEVWDKYFAKATKIVGCDIDQTCKNLKFSKDKISVVIGDSSVPETRSEIKKISSTYDIILDDGSHKSSDIIKNFCLYFPLLENNGLYIVEDLHCSYWPEFEGGLYNDKSSIQFFKQLADITNFEHWRKDKTRREHLALFEREYGIDFSDNLLSEVHSIEFMNSIVIVKKLGAPYNLLGQRNVKGNEASVVPSIKALNEQTIAETKNTENIDESVSTLEVVEQKQLKIRELEGELRELKVELNKCINNDD